MKRVEGLWKINQLFIFIASFSIVLVTLKFAATLLVPFLISIVLTIILNPPLTYLEQKKIPKAVSIVMIALLLFIPVMLFADNIASEVKSLSANFHEITIKFEKAIESSHSYFQQFDYLYNQNLLHKFLEKSNLLDIIRQLATQASNQFSNIFLILFTAGFMIMETDQLYSKMLKIAKENDRDANQWIEIVKKIKSYFIIKVKTSLLTSLLVFIVLWYYQISYLYLWVSLVFFFNFIPVIGSILAAIPAVVMAGIDQGGMVALWIALWYLGINTLVGNILEPKIMGKGLGLSSLVIFISMTFWGWVFGPAGMILSVPLTMVLQFMFEQYDETRWIALYLSDYNKEKIDETINNT